MTHKPSRKQPGHSPDNREDSLTALLDFGTDGYWEQDSRFRYTCLKGRLTESPQAVFTQDMLGKAPWNAGLDIMASDWKSHRQMLREARPFRNIIYADYRRSSPRYISISGLPVIIDGKLRGYRGIATDVTEHQLKENELIQSRAALDESEDMIFFVDRQTMRFLYVNKQACKLTRFSREELLAMGPQDALAQSRPELEKSYDALINSPSRGMTSQIPSYTKDGTYTMVEVHRRALWLNERWIIVSMVHDISERVRIERANERLRRMFAALSATNEAILKARTPEDLYQQVCDAAVEGGRFLVTAVLLPTAQGQLKVAAVAGDNLEQWRQLSISSDPGSRWGSGLAGTAFRTLEPCISEDFLSDERTRPWHEVARKSGIRSAAAVPLVRNNQGEGLLLLYSDVRRSFDPGVMELIHRMARNIIFALENFEHEEQRQRNEERVQYLATHDSLTGLPNRTLFHELLQMTLETASRYQHRFSLLFIDLDRFKLINDTLGHDAGDTLLRTVASRLRQCLRSSDVLARMGGDEFVVLLQNTPRLDRVQVVARKLLRAAIEPVELYGQDYRVTASIGIAMYPRHGRDAHELLRNADQAMYMAKEEGKNTYQFFSPRRDHVALERMTVETQLRNALQRDELYLHYQARTNLDNGEISGVEALLRWRNPKLGQIQPANFIPVAEETGLIIPIGRWVLLEACKQNMAWQEQGLPPIGMAVNLSTRQFMDPQLVTDLTEVLDKTGMPPELLELEITESMLITNTDKAVEILESLKAMGVRVAIDDFGVGYSSLAQLKNFPVDTLKVDRSFIRNLPLDGDGQSITGIIIAMGKSLRLKVIAEGVETAEQLDYLRLHDCDAIQGYYFSRPVRPTTFSRFMSQHLKSGNSKMR